jgi:hypothetical protein
MNRSGQRMLVVFTIGAILLGTFVSCVTLLGGHAANVHHERLPVSHRRKFTVMLKTVNENSAANGDECLRALKPECDAIPSPVRIR